MGYFSGDWAYDEYLNAIKEAKNRGREMVSLDTEHCSYKSNELIKEWAEQDGYTVKIGMDNICIYFKKKQ